MKKLLAPYGSTENLGDMAKVGKGKTPHGLADRMPSPDIASKVGIVGNLIMSSHRVVRLNRQG